MKTFKDFAVAFAIMVASMFIFAVPVYGEEPVDDTTPANVNKVEEYCFENLNYEDIMDMYHIEYDSSYDNETGTYDDQGRFCVYLPADYSPDKKYNVFVYLDGGNGCGKELNLFFPGCMGRYSILKFIDRLNASSLNQMIVVYPDYCSKATGDLLYEMVAYVVDNYPTYAESSSVEDISAAKEHFATYGYSNGSMYLGLIIADAPDIFGYMGFGACGWSVNEEVAANLVARPGVTVYFATSAYDYAYSGTYGGYQRCQRAAKNGANAKALYFCAFNRLKHSNDALCFHMGNLLNMMNTAVDVEEHTEEYEGGCIEKYTSRIVSKDGEILNMKIDITANPASVNYVYSVIKNTIPEGNISISKNIISIT